MPVAYPSRSMRRARADVLLIALVGLLACNPLAKKTDLTEAGASATPASAAPAANANAKTLDATTCNPGTSLDPPDKGKTVTTDHFRYTLLDARTDTAKTLSGTDQKVVLVKLQVENVTQKPDLNLSIAEVDLTKNRAAVDDRSKNRDVVAKTTFFYPREKMCVNLGADVDKGKIPPGTKVIGYYAYELPEPYTSLWFAMRNISPEGVTRGNLLNVTGSFRLK